MSAFQIRETRAYSTRQRRNPTSVHGPFPTRDEARQELLRLSTKSARNDNRSSYSIEEI
jgi:hypothetical protein